MSPAPVTRQCTCSEKHLCPAGQNLRRRVYETLNRIFGTEGAEGERAAWKAHRQAIREFARHVGGGR